MSDTQAMPVVELEARDLPAVSLLSPGPLAGGPRPSVEAVRSHAQAGLAHPSHSDRAGRREGGHSVRQILQNIRYFSVT